MTGLLASDLSVRLRAQGALDSVNLGLEPGRLTLIVGPNGAGKTTLLRAFAGLQAPTGGSVTLAGVPLARLRAADRAKAIAYLPQGGAVAWPLPVADVVALGRLPHGERPGALPPAGREAVAEALAAVGLAGFESRPATELSGGERARVLLARALATRSPVLLADEPVAALDPRHQLIVLEVLRARARAGAVVAAVMHDLALAARFAEDIVLLQGGRIEARGRPEQVFTEAQLAATFGIEASVTREGDRLLVAAQRPTGSPLCRPDAPEGEAALDGPAAASYEGGLRSSGPAWVSRWRTGFR